jgi:hypothetical protein
MPDESAESEDQRGDALAVAPHHALAEVALMLVPPDGRMDREQRSIRDIARKYLSVHWPRYWFQLHRQFLQRQVIPQAARQFSPRTIRHAGLVLPVTLGDPPLKLIWQLALRIADPDHEHAILVVVPTEDGGRETLPIPPSSPDVPFNATVIETTRPYLDGLRPAPANFQQRLWAAVAFLWPATSLEDLLDALPLSGGAIVHRTGEVGVYPGATNTVRRFYDRVAVGYERRTQGLPWDGRLDFGPPPQHPELQQRASCEAAIIRAAAEVARFYPGKKPSQEHVADRLGITPRRLQQLLSRKGHNLDWRQLQRKGEVAAHR